MGALFRQDFRVAIESPRLPREISIPFAPVAGAAMPWGRGDRMFRDELGVLVSLKEAQAIAAMVARDVPRAEAHKACVPQVVGFVGESHSQGRVVVFRDEKGHGCIVPLKEARAIAAKVAGGSSWPDAIKACEPKVVGFVTVTVGAKGNRLFRHKSGRFRNVSLKKAEAIAAKVAGDAMDLDAAFASVGVFPRVSPQMARPRKEPAPPPKKTKHMLEMERARDRRERGVVTLPGGREFDMMALAAAPPPPPFYLRPYGNLQPLHIASDGRMLFFAYESGWRYWWHPMTGFYWTYG